MIRVEGILGYSLMYVQQKKAPCSYITSLLAFWKPAHQGDRRPDVLWQVKVMPNEVNIGLTKILQQAIESEIVLERYSMIPKWYPEPQEG
jgi:hypothetical protein